MFTGGCLELKAEVLAWNDDSVLGQGLASEHAIC